MADRTRRSALTLAVIAVVPAVLAGGLAVVGHSLEKKVAVTPPTIAGAPVPPVAPTLLATPLLSVRRSPGVLALSQRQDVLTEALHDLSVSVDADSCLAVGVNGRLLTGTNTANSVIPASNLKVVVAEVALDALGAKAVFTTKIGRASCRERV